MGLRWPLTPKCTCRPRVVINGVVWRYCSALGWHDPALGHPDPSIPLYPVRTP